MIHWFFSCLHRRTSFPQTDPRTKQTSVQCLDCGKRLEYDWGAMRQGRALVEEIG